MSMPALDLPAAAIAALREGRKIDAIKLVRAATGMALQEAHDLIEVRLQDDASLRAAVDAAAATRRRRTMPVLIVALLLVLVAAFAVFG